MPDLSRRFLLLLGCLLLSGCAGYRLGSTGEFADGRSIEIHAFQNQTTEPRLTEELSIALRQQVHRDGTLLLETRDRGDILLEGSITRYIRQGLTFQPRDILTVRDFEIQILAKVKARNRNSGEVILDREVTGRTLVRGQIDLTEAERRATPLLMEDLARKITDLLVNEDW
ncbi:LPS assembly lipoprotein LptE [bacterium]|nr:LPS assembly lipoprotein LptE [bacterium]